MRKGFLVLAIVLMFSMSSFVSSFSVSSLIDSATNYFKMDGNGDTTINGNLKLGGDDNQNYIAFRGTDGDDQTLYTLSYIGERIYDDDSEKSELLLFKGNDYSSSAGPDRIRMVGGNIVFDTYETETGYPEDLDTAGTKGNTKMTIVSNGNVGIGTTSPSEKLHVQGSIKASASITANSFYYESDERLKTNISTIKNPIEKIMQLEGIEFNWKENGMKSLGFIAQEVEKVFPEVVSQNGEYKSVAYANLVAPLLETVKAQQIIIDNLTKRVEELEKSLK